MQRCFDANAAGHPRPRKAVAGLGGRRAGSVMERIIRAHPTPAADRSVMVDRIHRVGPAGSTGPCPTLVDGHRPAPRGRPDRASR